MKTTAVYGEYRACADDCSPRPINTLPALSFGIDLSFAISQTLFHKIDMFLSSGFGYIFILLSIVGEVILAY